MDFHDLWVVLSGVKTKTALFTMRLSYSGRAAHQAFLTQGQEAFLEGHVYSLERLGGVPCEKIRYDNLNSAVTQVLFGRARQENERWIAFRSHYGFEAWYCQPGHEGSHEKGGVEGEGGRFRRNHCVPVRSSTRSRSSTRYWKLPMMLMTLAVSAIAPIVLAMIGSAKRRFCDRCLPSRSTPP